MIEARLTELNYHAVLLYLGYRGQKFSPELEQQIRRAMDVVSSTSEPKLVYTMLPVKAGQPEGFSMPGKDIPSLLNSSHTAVLLAATLGSTIERAMMRFEITDMAFALIMDACASAAIENVCDNFEADLRVSLKPDQHLTDRFSPGYGDLPLDTQQQFCTVLNTSRRIGLTVSSRSLLIPRKSVTAILGISSEPQPHRSRGCEFCHHFLNCAFRKDGTSCGA